jgi:hypothetical protein
LPPSSGDPVLANRGVRFVVSEDISLLEKCAASAQACAKNSCPI